MKLTAHFTLAELSKTQVRGVDNTPPPFIVTRLQAVAQMILEPVREQFQRPVIVSSGYRSIPVNRAIGSKDESQHVKGYAVDFEIRSVSHPDVVRFIVSLEDWDQIILEFCTCEANGAEDCLGWIHCSYVGGNLNRKQILVARRTLGGATSYRVISRDHIPVTDAA